MKRVISVGLLSPPFSVLSYGVPECLHDSQWLCGLRVAVPLGNAGLRCGVVLDADAPQPPDGIAIKNCVWPLERTPVLNANFLTMVHQLALRHLSTDGEVLGSILPAGLRTVQVKFKVYEGGAPKTIPLKQVAAMGEQELCHFAESWKSGAVEVVDAAYNKDAQEMCVVLQDPPWPVRPAAKRQLEVMEYLWENGATSRRVLLKELGSSAAQPLAALAERGLISIGPLDECTACPVDSAPQMPAPSAPAFVLTDAQQKALDAILHAFASPAGAHHLLFGITGSGKTAVYLDFAERALRQGRSVLLLAPEVALACKLEKAVRDRFAPDDIFFYHGYQSQVERERTFRTLATRTTPAIIVGTRSALFLPVPLLGGIILDEEHDGSFKQDERFTYQAKEVAHFLIQQAKGVLVLGSATPDVKTFYAVQEGGIEQSVLSERVGGGTLPSVEFVDIKGMRSSDGLLAERSLEALKQTVNRGEQVVILLNRRGYAPLMYCLDCGEVARCPDCEVGLTYHKNRERLVCHYCGYSVPYPITCGKCKGLHYLPMGEGTEKLEEGLVEVLPAGSKVLRLDRDSTRRQGQMESILDAFAREEAQVLVGTQMLSKGHHFPNVTLAIVADGDLGLNLPDYRAAERTFQLLVQSSGRAGRGEKEGRVLIQTRDPSHYCWQFVPDADYQGFYAEEIARRKKYSYPPFIKLALIRFSFPFDYEKGMQVLNDLSGLAREAGKKYGAQILGPTPSPMALIRGRKRFQWAVKSADWGAIRAVFHALKARVGKSKEIRIALDLDPINML